MYLWSMYTCSQQVNNAGGVFTCLQMALKFLEGAARDGFAAANALIGKVTPHCFASYADSLCSVYLVQLLCC